MWFTFYLNFKRCKYKKEYTSLVFKRIFNMSVFNLKLNKMSWDLYSRGLWLLWQWKHWIFCSTNGTWRQQNFGTWVGIHAVDLLLIRVNTMIFIIDKLSNVIALTMTTPPAISHICTYPLFSFSWFLGP